MKCPYCSDTSNKVIDSRLSRDGLATRRRRECVGCQRRYTTYERVEEVLPVVVKKDGVREEFDRNKIFGGMRKACHKRPVSVERLEEAVTEVVKYFQEKGEKEVGSPEIGEKVMEQLQKIDQVAYVRFASVYREFKDIGEFMKEVKDILKPPKKK